MDKAHDAILSIRDLRMNYGSRYVLKGINLDVYEDQIIGYIGPNGAGKSTTVKIMLGLVEGYTGDIHIFGQNIADGNVDYKKRIGYVPETAEIYDTLTAREYLTFIGELYGLHSEDADYKAKQLMRTLGLEELYDSRIVSFSKGMRQKVLLIASMLHNPDILFLDEPLAAQQKDGLITFALLLLLFAFAGLHFALTFVKAGIGIELALLAAAVPLLWGKVFAVPWKKIENA
ncbi:ABC transporter ATP-binding protein [Paenibacillus nasutitermitis]|uniref:ABC transporter domain-containing protein n=1 Tax=Paenibacillus nasutitermitis TaxID=1652958 RepID=A0A916Z9R6_9BACL|nr:ABC transporter ATP-binding protein [Paenibacillus nasutitermitis]GGD82260.1 hypothetical protein GCM10010911_45460 [Paenibacillus nasutitermitis]